MSIKSILIFLYLIFMNKVMDLIAVVDIGVLPLVENSIGITFFVDVTNEDRHNICQLYSRCKKCCLIDSNKEYCDVIVAYGEDMRTVKPRDRKTLVYVAPMLFQHDLVGYCEFLLIYHYNNTKEEVDLTIPFDTQVGVRKTKEIMNQYVSSKKIKHCSSLDEDSLNNCAPVDCNIKYFDKRPVFDHVSYKCVEVPICLTSPDKELPDYVLVPDGNICRNLDLPLTVQDIYAISTGLGTISMPLHSPSQIKLKVMSNCSTISQNINLLRDLMYGKMCPANNDVTLDYSECITSALLTILICIISICSFLIILICCINYTVWLYIKWSDGKLTKFWKDYKNPFKRRKSKKSKSDKINSTVRNALLREVIVKDIPLELRYSVVDVCGRTGKEVERKKRYRGTDVGSQVSLQQSKESVSSSMLSSVSLDNDKE